MSENKTILETYEWDNVWWEQTSVSDVPRVLYIGDSISCGTRNLATAAAENKILFDGFATSKAVDNPYFYDAVRMFAKQQGYRNAIVINNGLHGAHLEDSTEYKEHYENMVKFLLSEFKDTKLILLLTTCINNDSINERTKNRNKAVCEIAEKYNLPVIDFYKVSEGIQHLLSDGVHFTEEGYKVLAKELAGRVREIIE